MVGKNTLAWFREWGGWNKTAQHPVAILAVYFLFSNWSPCKIPHFSTPNHKKEQYKMSGYLRNVAVGQKGSAIHQDCVATRRLGFRQRRFLTPIWPPDLTRLTERSLTRLLPLDSLSKLWNGQQITKNNKLGEGPSSSKWMVSISSMQLSGKSFAQILWIVRPQYYHYSLLEYKKYWNKFSREILSESSIFAAGATLKGCQDP